MEISKPKGKFKQCSFKDPFIYVVDNTLSKKFCKNIIKKFDNSDKKHRGATSDLGNNIVVNNDIKRSTDLLISGKSDWEKEDEVFYKSLNKHYLKYLKKLPKKGKIFSDELLDTGYQIQRTDPGEFYVFHHDFDSNSVRYLSFIWYLNDVEYDGYTEFIDGTRIQPKAGRFLMFPATWTYIHRGYPPKNEVKYICTGWMSSK